MDDFSISNLHESRNEWSARLVTILTPLIIEGFNSIFNESIKLCENNDEMEKYLMTFQNFISRIPKWNDQIIENEYQRILEKSNCNYLGDLLSCVHVIQLKILTCVRAGKKQKNIKIDIPTFSKFLHNIYIHVARKLYTNVYLYELNIKPLQKQKYMREYEIIVQECILTAIRETMPIEELLKAYIDESIEEEVDEEIIEKPYEVIEDDKEDIYNEDIKIETPVEIVEPPIQMSSNNNFKENIQKNISFSENVSNDDNTIVDLNDIPIKIHHDENVSLDDILSVDTQDNNEPPIIEFEEL